MALDRRGIGSAGVTLDGVKNVLAEVLRSSDNERIERQDREQSLLQVVYQNSFIFILPASFVGPFL